MRHSRCCAEFTGTADRHQERWLDYLKEAGPGVVVLPCSDDGLELIARHGRLLGELGLVTIEADGDVLLAMLDKERTYALAAEAGIGVPETVTVSDAGQLRAAAAEFSYPCALKPALSHVFARHFPFKGFVAENRAQLELAFERTAGLEIKMMLTELIPGRDPSYPSCHSYLDENGEPLFTATKIKLRQYPVDLGSSCYHLTDRDPEAAELGVRFLRFAGMRGLAHVEFKRDVRDGRLKLIECNPRFTGTVGLFAAAGVDLPLFTYNRLVGRDTPPVGEYREGLGLWWPRNDFRAFRAHRRRGELSIAGWASSLLHRQRFPLASWRDPMPTIVTLTRRLGNRFRRPGRATGRGLT